MTTCVLLLTFPEPRLSSSHLDRLDRRAIPSYPRMGGGRSIHISVGGRWPGPSAGLEISTKQLNEYSWPFDESLSLSFSFFITAHLLSTYESGIR